MEIISNANNKKSWFENNPKNTLVLIILLFSMVSMLLVEKILEREKILVNFVSKRYIRLKEHQPLITAFFEAFDHNKMDSHGKLIRKRYLFRTDENGIIMPSKIYDDPDLVLVFLGGSTTECLSVDEENRFPFLVGRLLQQDTGLKVNSYNSGVSGNNSLHSIDILLNKIIPLNPNIVIMMHNINDLSTLLHEKTYWNKNVYRSPIFELNFLDFFRIIKDSTFPNLYYSLNNILRLNLTSRINSDEFVFSRGKKIAIDKDYLTNEFKMNLVTFINICEARRITPVLMTQQNIFDNIPESAGDSFFKNFESKGITYNVFKEIYDLFNQTIREVGTKYNILVIDLDEKIPKEKTYIYDYLHFNDAGSKLAAKIISEDLKRLDCFRNLKIKK